MKTIFIHFLSLAFVSRRKSKECITMQRAIRKEDADLQNKNYIECRTYRNISIRFESRFINWG